MQTRAIILSHPVRTPVGAYNGALKSVPATELGAIVVGKPCVAPGLLPMKSARW